MTVAGVVDAYGGCTCSDIFNENYIPSRPHQGGVGPMHIHGVQKPVYRALDLRHRLGTSQPEVDGSHGTVAACLSLIDATHVSVLPTSHVASSSPLVTERVHLVLRDALAAERMSIERIDDDHGNAPAA